MTDFLARHGLNKTATVPTLSNLLVYYGYPIAYKGLYYTDAVISAIGNSYKYWIVGDTYGNASHPEITTTTTIIQGVQALGVKVYGYVPIGQSTQGLTVAQIKTKIDEWAALDVDGIFLDEFGFDYLNTRSKQIEIVNYVHSLNLPYCANAQVVEDFACDNISQVSYPSGDWRYINFTTYNPSNLTLPRNSTDVYMFENFCFNNLGVSVIWDTQYPAVNVSARAAAGNFAVWALAVLAESTPGTYDVTKIGTFKTSEEISAYVSANAFLYDYKVVGISGSSFGSAGNPITFQLYDLPSDAKKATIAASNNYITNDCSRFFGTVKVTITNTDVLQTVAVDSTAGNPLESAYPNNDVPKIVASTTQPSNPALNTLWVQI